MSPNLQTVVSNIYQPAKSRADQDHVYLCGKDEYEILLGYELNCFRNRNFVWQVRETSQPATAMSTESYKKSTPFVKCSPRILLLCSAGVQRQRCGDNALIPLRRRPTSCARLKQSSANLHNFGHLLCGRLSSIGCVITIRI